MTRTGMARSQQAELSSAAVRVSLDCCHCLGLNSFLIRNSIAVAVISLLGLLTFNNIAADDGPPASPHREPVNSILPPLVDHQFLPWNESSMVRGLILWPSVFPRKPRVSRSCQPLLQVTLAGGDRFMAECLDWNSETVRFRLLNGQTIQVPNSTVVGLHSPNREIGLIDESFELASDDVTFAATNGLIDDSAAADGNHSLRLRSSSDRYRIEFPSSLKSLRIEFRFRIQSTDSSTGCGQWRLIADSDQGHKLDSIVQIDSDRRIRCRANSSLNHGQFQPLSITDGWHTFLALVTPQRTRFIVDDSLLASFRSAQLPLRELQFQSAGSSSKNTLWIDAIQVRRILDEPSNPPPIDHSINQDRISLDDGGEIFGQLVGLGRMSIELEAFGHRNHFPWTRTRGLIRRQTSTPIQQHERSEVGLVSTIELQSLVDRPDFDAERWTVTITGSSPNGLTARHWAAGELDFNWSEIRRVVPHHFGQSLVIDARTFHLGNAIRPDFRRHHPDGTELRFDVTLGEIPRGKTYLSLNVAELEAAGPTAPPGSPFLKQLRAGQLLTEVEINGHKIGDLNSLIRFKTGRDDPDRLRLAIPRERLKSGGNSVRIIQKTLDESGSEYDDCEIGAIRLEFDPVN